MCKEEITGAVIESLYVTNDLAQIDGAICCNQRVEYVSRARAEFLARCTRRPQWSTLARSPAILLFVNGVCYRRKAVVAEAAIGFPLCLTNPAASATVAT